MNTAVVAVPMLSCISNAMWWTASTGFIGNKTWGAPWSEQAVQCKDGLQESTAISSATISLLVPAMLLISGLWFKNRGSYIPFLALFFFFFLKALSSVMSYCKKTIESPLNKDWECHLHLLNPAVSIYLCRTEHTCFLTWRCKLPFPVMH